jgi:hypothetical protein
LLRLEARARAEPEPPREQRRARRHLRRRRLAELGHHAQRLLLRAPKPRRRRRGDAALAHPLLQPAPLPRRYVHGGGRVHDGQELAWHDPERPPHRQHTHERTLLVQRVLDVGRGDALRAGKDGQEDGDGVGRVEGDERACDRDGVAGAELGREAVTAHEPRPPLLDGDVSHGAVLPTAAA